MKIHVNKFYRPLYLNCMDWDMFEYERENQGLVSIS